MVLRARRTLLLGSYPSDPGPNWPDDIEYLYESADGVTPSAASIKALWINGAGCNTSGWQTTTPDPYDFAVGATGYWWSFGHNGSGTWPGCLVAYHTAVGSSNGVATGPGCNNFQLLVQMSTLQCSALYPVRFYFVNSNPSHLDVGCIRTGNAITTWKLGINDGSTWTYGADRSFTGGGDFRSQYWNYMRLWYNTGVISVRFWRNTLDNEPSGYDLENHDLKTDPAFSAVHPDSWDVFQIDCGGSYTGTSYVRIHDYNVYFGQGTP